MSQRGWLPVSTVWSSLLPAQRKLARGPMSSPVRVIPLHSPLPVYLSFQPSLFIGPVCLSDCLSFQPSLSSFAHVCLFICLSVLPAISLHWPSLSVCLSVCPSSHLSLHSPMSVYLSVSLSFQPSLSIGTVCLFVCLFMFFQPNENWLGDRCRLR